MNNLKWIENLKTGDKVIVEVEGLLTRPGVHCWQLGEVKKLTNTQVVVSRGYRLAHEARFNKSNGRERGDSDTKLIEPTKANLKALSDYQAREKALYKINNTRWSEVSDDVVLQVAELLKDDSSSHKGD